MVGGPEWAAAVLAPVVTFFIVLAGAALGVGVLIGWLVF